MDVKRDVVAGQNGRNAGSALVYDSSARLSKNPTTGEYEKIETQLSDNKLVIEWLGGMLGRELEDGLSAWKSWAAWRRVIFCQCQTSPDRYWRL